MGIKFSIGADLDEAALKTIRAIPDNDRSSYKSGYSADTVHSMNKTKEAFRLIYKPQAYCDTKALSEEYLF